MTTADAILFLTWVGLTAYALFGGADFGAGFWDLTAGRRQGAAIRALIEDTIGPVWEANHVWLIFAIVVVWTAFPMVFAAVASTLYIPLTLVAIGIILRGSGFAFRKSVADPDLRRRFGMIFGLSSIVTPFFLGAIAGGVASGRVPPGNATGDPIGSWLNPTSVLGGVLAVGLCAFLAAVYLTSDARRTGDAALVEAFRRRALASGLTVGGGAFLGIAVIHADAPTLFAGLTAGALPLVVLSAVAGIASLALLVQGRFALARGTAGLAVGAVLWGWAVAQYPYLLVGSLTIDAAAGPPATLTALLISLLVGAVLVVPSMVALFVLAQRSRA
ncbi:MAG: cytochrome d ubiquinol oxidase subunit II [Candidatus Limnocylindrales bacterium]